ncbi:M20/M25/M40 family metallo-hydrolase [Clostridium sp. WILCCON 0269]|uniref:M20/M25/M40 family metallo-hydrolase n=1 Tax=Candidatus Clostridium eludens TaxID=3381663 RepID=A0ABW8SFA2_9CLOT
MNDLFKEIEKLTLDLVNIPSINNSIGERNICNRISQYINNIEYFKEHKDYTFQVSLNQDPYKRVNVFALLKGEKNSSNKTIILHGHIDTVGVDNFGELEEYAFDSKVLNEKLKEMYLPEEIKNDLNSGDWIFGRGAADMKSGVAVHLVILKELSKNVKNFSGNILFMANPVEENQHTGIIEALDTLNYLKEKYYLEYNLAINNDYICPLYPGDNTRYVYTGAVGKILPCFYIVGKETHVGQYFEGLNSNLIGAELIKNIDLNTDLCDEYRGEHTLPPSVLKCKDLKGSYDVQTPFTTFIYFNYFVHNSSVNKVIDNLKHIAEKSFNAVISKADTEYKKFCKLTKEKYSPLPWKSNILTYGELYEGVKNRYGYKLDEEISNLTKTLTKQDMDMREICLNIVEKVWKLSNNRDPSVVLFFAPPYCPHNILKSKDKSESNVIKKIEECVEEISRESNEEFKMLQFFPSLSDSSYFKIDDDFSSLENLIDNFPNWKEIYNIPVDKIKKLNIPAVNYGCYGKDAHKWTERVYKPYSFNILPKLILTTVHKLLNE